MSAERGSGDPWYRRAFGEYYSRVYSHRSDEEAARALRLLAGHLDIDGLRVLDVACGNGRHLRALGTRPAIALGIDLSPELLDEADGLRADLGYFLVRGDMRRLPVASGSFDLVLSMFTSFGYFPRERENREAAWEMARVLAGGGHLLLDYLNYSTAVRNLTPSSERTSGDLRIRERRALVDGGRRLTKDVRILRGGRAVESYRESLILYRPSELDELLGTVGLWPVARWGSEEGGAFDGERSPRYIVLVRRDRA
jgi:SAM-dependent methyltransferase